MLVAEGPNHRIFYLLVPCWGAPSWWQLLGGDPNLTSIFTVGSFIEKKNKKLALFVWCIASFFYQILQAKIFIGFGLPRDPELPIVLVLLKHLILDTVTLLSLRDMSSILSFLKIAPKLQKLEINVSIWFSVLERNCFIKYLALILLITMIHLTLNLCDV